MLVQRATALGEIRPKRHKIVERNQDRQYPLGNWPKGVNNMMKTIGSVMIAAMLVATAANAQDIRPLDSTASSQAQIFALGAVPTGFVVIGTIVIAGVVYAVAQEADGTAGT